MNFNSDYQSNRNRLHNREIINLSLNNSKTKTKSICIDVFRIFFEISFVAAAIGIGYIQGLKSYNTYAQSKSLSNIHTAILTKSEMPVPGPVQNASSNPESKPENRQDPILVPAPTR